MSNYISMTVRLETTSCCVCGVAFAVPDWMLKKRQEDKGTFYCPNGHRLYFMTSEVDRLLAKLDNAQRDRDRQRARREEVERRLVAQRGATTRLKNRIHNGVCPRCKRHFANVERHMKSKHPDFEKGGKETS